MADSTPKFDYITSCFDQDIEEYCSCLKKFAPRIKQLSPGYFLGHSTIITLPHLTLIRRKSAARYFSACWVPHEATFVFPLSRGDIYANGRLFGPQDQLASPGNLEARLIFPENFEQLIITIPMDALPRFLDAEECGIFNSALNAIDKSPIDASLKNATTTRLLDIFLGIENSPAALAPEQMRNLCRDIVNILFDYLAYHRRSGHMRVSNHEKILQRALALIEANPSQLLTLDEMAREIYASKRSIQYAFSSIVGVSPMRFQKMHRINLIREELKTTQATANFASIVAKYSFSNPGRMSKEYAEFFGQRPKDTLRLTPGEPDPA